MDSEPTKIVFKDAKPRVTLTVDYGDGRIISVRLDATVEELFPNQPFLVAKNGHVMS